MDTTFKKAVEALIDHFDGSQVRAAQAIGVRQPTISGWLNSGHYARAKHALRAEQVTGGLVKASDLCPDLRNTVA